MIGKISNKAQEGAIKAYGGAITHLWAITSNLGYFCTKYGAFLLQVCALLAAISLFIGCSTVKMIPIETRYETRLVDSIAWHDSTIINYITKERIVDVVNPYDTLKLETTYARAQAYVDTATNNLKGSIENKADVPIRTQIKWKEKIVYRDSIVVKEVPVKVEVVKTKTPKWAWIMLALNVLALGVIAVRIYLKTKGI